jgi:hypothetical protein
MSVLSPTISKLYTPPTCTLEVTAKASPLSRWTGTPTVRSIQFLLSFDSLAQRARESVEIYGDQTQLSTLTETVTHYIQTVLANRAGDLPLSVPEQPDPATLAPDISGAIALRPRSLLTHELWLGTLATAQSGPSLLLKASQLYDLATALEDCTTDFQQLPTLITADRPAGWEQPPGSCFKQGLSPLIHRILTLKQQWLRLRHLPPHLCLRFHLHHRAT